MRDYRECPARTVVDSAPGRQEFSRCAVISGHVKWFAQVAEGVCRQCAAAGEADIANPVIDGILTQLMKGRVFDLGNTRYPAERTPEVLLREAIEQGRVSGPGEALSLLDQAVASGMSPQEAARIAIALRLGGDDDPA